MPVAKITRRHLLVGLTGFAATAGGAGLWLVSRRISGWRFRNRVDRGASFAPSVYLAVEPSGDIVIWLVRAEMGQGVETALPMIVAEELDADWPRVRLERAILDQRYDYGSMFTAASASVQSLWIELRRAGATARHMLIGAAADLWDVPRSELATERSTVVHAASGRAASYGELADRGAAQRAPLRPRLRTSQEFRLIGQPLPRRDLPAKIKGEAVFGLDVRVPGMLFAAIARSPTFGGDVQNVDDAAARAVDGVVDVLRVPSGVATIAMHSYGALRGRDALQIVWQPAPQALSSAELSAALRTAISSTAAAVARDDGGVVEALQSRSSAAGTYEVPYLAHAPLEPMNCTAHVADGRCEIWAPTQAPEGALDTAARITGLPLDRITVHTTYLGGGFGRRTAADFVAEAVDLSMRLDRPVQVLWSREDDMRNGFYRPAIMQRIEAIVDDAGLPAAWRHRVATAQDRVSSEIDSLSLMGADTLPYNVGPMRLEWIGVRAPLPSTIWRSVGHSFTAFAIECFLDELAHANGRDPVSYRLSLLPEGHRLRGCIERVAELSGWAAGEQRPLGIAAVECFGSYIALVAQVDPGAVAGGQIRVSKAWCVVDCGTVVNPDIAAAQIEGGILFGLTAALLGRVTVNAGAVVEGNFDTYPLLRIDETPEIEISFVPSGESPGGVGELGVPPVAPAVANALFAAHRVRLRTLPLVASS